MSLVQKQVVSPSCPESLKLLGRHRFKGSLSLKFITRKKETGPTQSFLTRLRFCQCEICPSLTRILCTAPTLCNIQIKSSLGLSTQISFREWLCPIPSKIMHTHVHAQTFNIQLHACHYGYSPAQNQGLNALLQQGQITEHFVR